MIVNGTTYDDRTAPEVVGVLERCRADGTRIRIHTGETYRCNARCGKDWLEEHDVTGCVSRSTGRIKVPILVHNKRSLGGPMILDHDIIRIRATQGGHDLYRHDLYHYGDIVLQPSGLLRWPYEVRRDGSVQARFDDVHQARRWLRAMGIDMYSEHNIN